MIQALSFSFFGLSVVAGQYVTAPAPASHYSPTYQHQPPMYQHQPPTYQHQPPPPNYGPAPNAYGPAPAHTPTAYGPAPAHTPYKTPAPKTSGYGASKTTYDQYGQPNVYKETEPPVDPKEEFDQFWYNTELCKSEYALESCLIECSSVKSFFSGPRISGCIIDFVTKLCGSFAPDSTAAYTTGRVTIRANSCQRSAYAAAILNIDKVVKNYELVLFGALSYDSWSFTTVKLALDAIRGYTDCITDAFFYYITQCTKNNFIDEGAAQCVEEHLDHDACEYAKTDYGTDFNIARLLDYLKEGRGKAIKYVKQYYGSSMVFDALKVLLEAYDSDIDTIHTMDVAFHRTKRTASVHVCPVNYLWMNFGYEQYGFQGIPVSMVHFHFPRDPPKYVNFNPETPTPTTTAPATSTPYPTTTAPATSTPYPTTTAPATSTPYPTTTAPATSTPYPTTTAPATSTPYPTTTAPATSTPYPTTTAPATSTPYPTTTAPATSTPYPTTTAPATSTPYPTTTAPATSTPYPTTTAPATSTPYPTTTAPATSTPYPTTTAPATSTPYPTTTAPATSTPYPTTTAPATSTPYPTPAAAFLADDYVKHVPKVRMDPFTPKEGLNDVCKEHYWLSKSLWTLVEYDMGSWCYTINDYDIEFFESGKSEKLKYEYDSTHNYMDWVSANTVLLEDEQDRVSGPGPAAPLVNPPMPDAYAPCYNVDWRAQATCNAHLSRWKMSVKCCRSYKFVLDRNRPRQPVEDDPYAAPVTPAPVVQHPPYPYPYPYPYPHSPVHTPFVTPTQQVLIRPPTYGESLLENNGPVPVQYVHPQQALYTPPTPYATPAPYHGRYSEDAYVFDHVVYSNDVTGRLEKNSHYIDNVPLATLYHTRAADLQDAIDRSKVVALDKTELEAQYLRAYYEKHAPPKARVYTLSFKPPTVPLKKKSYYINQDKYAKNTCKELRIDLDFSTIIPLVVGECFPQACILSQYAACLENPKESHKVYQAPAPKTYAPAYNPAPAYGSYGYRQLLSVGSSTSILSVVGFIAGMAVVAIAQMTLSTRRTIASVDASALV